MNNKPTINSIINGNCLDILPNINGNFIIVTDPPFNVGYHYNDYKDKLNDDDYYTMLSNVLENRKSVVIHYPEELYKIAFQIGMFPEKVFAWVYNSNTAKQHRDIVFFGIKPNLKNLKQPFKNPTDKRIAKKIAEGKMARGYDWWNINQVKNVSKVKTNHPCQMPVEVMINIIKLLPEDAIIVDPFAGSGTTLVAAKMLGRKYIGIELSKEYCDIIKTRLEILI